MDAPQASLPQVVQSCTHAWFPRFNQARISSVACNCKRLQVAVAISILAAVVIKMGLPSFPGHSLSSASVASLGQTGPLADQMEGEGRIGKVIDPVVSVDWLHKHLGDPNIKVLDASWCMPDDRRDPFQEYKACHIPGALFFDINAIADPTSHLPHMLPSDAAFASAVTSLGIHNSDTVVVYDGKGIFSSARVWWMFRVFGHDNIVVLDGGLPQWRSSGFDIETTTSKESMIRIQGASEAVQKTYQGQQIATAAFKTSFQSHHVWSLEEVKCNIEEKKYEVIDARCKARYDGVQQEPREGIRAGHIPGSKCVPFTEVLKDGGTLLGAKDMEEKFKEAGVSLNSPIVTSCGTGVTSCVLALALHRLGKESVAVYDGSWTEWGGRSDTPIATNAVPRT